MTRWLLVGLLMGALALPARADVRSEIVQALTTTRNALHTPTLPYARYLEEAGRVSSAVDIVVYSRTRLPKRALSSLRFVNAQMRALEDAWALRYRIGLSVDGEPGVVLFERNNFARLSRAFLKVDPRLKIESYRAEGNTAPGYVSLHYDRLVAGGLRLVVQNLEVTLVRLQ